VIAMYNDIAKQIVERVNIFAGRTMENLNSWVGVRPLSSLDTSLSFPVSARSRLALRSRMMIAEVSLISMSDMMKNALATIVTNQKFHRQPLATVKTEILLALSMIERCVLTASNDRTNTWTDSYHYN
jgi:hypothetical protein